MIKRLFRGGEPSRLLLLLADGFLITVFVFLFIGLVVKTFPVNMKVFDPFSDAFQDFDYTDLYYSQLRNVTRVGADIVLVNIRDSDRRGLARLVNRIRQQDPAVIGLDVFFEGLKDPETDSILLAALGNGEQVVIGSDFRDGRELPPAFNHLHPGYVNLYGKEAGVGVVRKFAPFRKRGADTLYSFGVQVARLYAPEKTRKYLATTGEKEHIHYLGSQESFITFDREEVLDPEADLGVMRGKIVLLGYLGEDMNHPTSLTDLHFTPLNPKLGGRSFPDMYGVVIHANIIHSILSERTILNAGKYSAWFIAFLFGLLVNTGFVWLHVNRPVSFYFYAKVLQLVLSILVLYAVFYAFHSFRIQLDAIPMVVVLVLTVDLMLFYEILMRKLKARGLIRNSYILQKIR